ncbi:MAG: hypothetical protein JST54_24295 [Deltaproteobacteria bacterium]|nr:hypothetical protein [Deltaproteobacteria bacterium]
MAGNKVKKAHEALIEKAERYLGLLHEVNTPEANALADAIGPEIDTCIADVNETLSYKSRFALLKQKAKAATADLKMVVGGTYALIDATDAKLYAQLPPRENWSDAAGSIQADHLVNALRASGSGSAMTYANQISTVAEVERKAQQALVAAGSGRGSVGVAATAMAELRMRLDQADLYLRKLARPGSVLAGKLKKARGIKSGRKPTVKAPVEAASAGESEASAAPAVAPAGQPSQITSQAASAQVVQPTVVVSQPVPAAVGGFAGGAHRTDHAREGARAG